MFAIEISVISIFIFVVVLAHFLLKANAVAAKTHGDSSILSVIRIVSLNYDDI